MAAVLLLDMGHGTFGEELRSAGRWERDAWIAWFAWAASRCPVCRPCHTLYSRTLYVGGTCLRFVRVADSCCSRRYLRCRGKRKTTPVPSTSRTTYPLPIPYGRQRREVPYIGTCSTLRAGREPSLTDSTPCSQRPQNHRTTEPRFPFPVLPAHNNESNTLPSPLANILVYHLVRWNSVAQRYLLSTTCPRRTSSLSLPPSPAPRLTELYY
ncbi:hypothetical protein F4802DRAFT_298898 [Xylaria palmicola]|nr:hypothetical protein F4802DRAFT_298898 [Xylaria palmicola]